MTSVNFQQWIQHPETLNRDTLYELRNLLARYPYFQSLRLLYLKNLYILHDISFGGELRKAVLYIADRRQLFRLIERMVGGGYAMFSLGVLVSYFLIFPLTFRFLGTYQVSGEVDNLIALDSYISTLVMMCLAMGIVFEIPILSWLFAKLGFLSADFMRRYRKHAVVIVLVIAAVITPTSDVFTLSLVAFPMTVPLRIHSE